MRGRLLGLCLLLAFGGCAQAQRSQGPLDGVRSFATVGAPLHLQELAASRYDALIVAEPATGARAVVERLHESLGESNKPKLVLAAVDVSARKNAGTVLDRIVDEGFDGAVLSGAEAYSGTPGRDARADAIELVESLALQAHAKRKTFAIVPLDVPDLIAEPSFAGSVQGIAQAGLWFASTTAGADARQAAGFRDAFVPALRGAAAAGIPVFTIDFASDPNDAAFVYAAARSERFIAYVTTRAQAGLTLTPPPVSP